MVADEVEVVAKRSHDGRKKSKSSKRKLKKPKFDGSKLQEFIMKSKSKSYKI